MTSAVFEPTATSGQSVTDDMRGVQWANKAKRASLLASLTSFAVVVLTHLPKGVLYASKAVEIMASSKLDTTFPLAF